jgi:hypothetical protein
MLDGTPYAACNTDLSCALTNVTANHNIAVNFTLITNTVTPSAGANGSISPATAQTVNYGSNISFTATPNTGYVVNGWTLDGSAYAACGTNSNCTLTNITAAHTIAVNFAVATFTVAPSAGANGAISPATAQTVDYGSDISFTAIPDTGYKVSGWTLNGSAYAACGTSTTCDLSNVTANRNIAVNFTIITNTVTPSAGTNGTISPATAQTVNYGSNISFTATPNTGYVVNGWTLDGSAYAACGTNSNCTLTNVTAAHTIAVNFAVATFTVAPSAGANGAISPATAQTVDYGSDISFTAIPDTGYKVSGWTLNGSAYAACGTSTTCDLTNVTAGHSIAVSFTIITNTVTPSAGANGTISPATAQTVNYGSDISFTATPSTGYVVNGWTLDGSAYAACGTDTTCDLTNVTAGHSIAVSFIITTNTVTPSAGANGAISPATAQTVDYGSDISFTAIPNTGYKVSGWTLNGSAYAACGTSTTCDLTNVTASRNIAVNFTLITNTVTPSAGTNGSISPATAQTVNYGSDISFTATPDTGYVVNGWTLDGSAYAACGTSTTCNLTNVTAGHSIAVSFIITTNTVTPSAGANGTISPATAQTVNYGSNINFTATPNTGYAVNGWTLDGSAYASCGTSTTCNLTNVTTGHSIAVSFTIITNTVTPSAGANGTISPATAQTVNYGSNINFTATPSTGYVVNGWTLDGSAYAACGTSTTCNLTNVTAGHSIAVSFIITTNTVTPSAGANGTISPATAQTVNYGSNINFTATPSTGYVVNGWTLDGSAYASCGTSTTCNLTNVTASHSIAVSFIITTNTVTPSAGANGSISPATAQAVPYGSDISFTATPNSGYIVSSWTLDGSTYASCGANSSCTITNVTANHSIAVSFVLATTISLQGSPLLLSPGTTGALTITNTGAVTASSISTNLPPELVGKVLLDNSNCTTLAPAASCYLRFTATDQKAATTSITISGNNTNSVGAVLTVARPYSTNGTVNAVLFDSTNNLIYLGGSFSYVGPYTGGAVPVDKTTGLIKDPFSQIDSTQGQGIYSVIPDGNGGWYIGGDFTQIDGVTVNRLAHILADGSLDTTWTPGASGRVYSLALSGTTLYVGGSFSTLGGQTRNNIGAVSTVDGTATTWNPNANSIVNTIAISGSTLYVGGIFTNIGGQTRNYLAALNTSGTATSWNPNANSSVSEVVISGSIVYVCGNFTTINGQTRNYLAALNLSDGTATTWAPNPNSSVSAIETNGTTVYVGGYFTSIAGQTRNYIAALNVSDGQATTWNPSITGSGISALALDGSNLYVGGTFTAIGGQIRNRIATLSTATGNATAWNPSTNNTVYSLAFNSDTVYVGGTFTSINGQSRNNIAAVSATDGTVTSWDPNANSIVSALALGTNVVYVGGQFTTIAGQTRNYLAAINSSSTATSWNPAPSYYVTALGAGGSNVYVGGGFTTIGGQSRSKLAAVDATTGLANSWNPSPNNSVMAIATNSSTVYAGGTFTTIAGQTRNRIAAFNISDNSITTWSPNIGAGTVNAIALTSTLAYVGGTFSTVGASTYNRVAALNLSNGTATSWNPNASSTVNALAVSGNIVYVGGSFTTIGGQARSYIAAINASTGLATSWNPTLSPTNKQIYGLAASNSAAYIGGDFTLSNGLPVPFFANVPMSFAP